MQTVSRILFAALLAGCASSHHEIHTVSSTGSAMCRSDDACGPGARCINGQCTRDMAVTPPAREIHDASQGCQLQNVYFAFDSSALDAQDATIADHNAACILQHRAANSRITVVGRTDPRGSTEYNLALGERRAANLARQLERNGVPRNEVVTQSVGNEYATGNDEVSWARDRFAGFDRPQ